MSMIEESSFVRIWLDQGEEKGKIKGERAIILRLGRKRFGEPDAATLEKLESIQQVERLEEISDRLITATNWNEAIGQARDQFNILLLA